MDTQTYGKTGKIYPWWESPHHQVLHPRGGWWWGGDETCLPDSWGRAACSHPVLGPSWNSHSHRTDEKLWRERSTCEGGKGWSEGKVDVVKERWRVQVMLSKLDLLKSGLLLDTTLLRACCQNSSCQSTAWKTNQSEIVSWIFQARPSLTLQKSEWRSSRCY